MSSAGGTERAATDRAFGSENRARLLAQFLDAEGPVEPATAWKFVYRLLLWIDRTTGLAHCYESDKCQPGRPWYGRSLAFHDWLASQLGVAPVDVASEVDWFFRNAVRDLARRAQEDRARAAAVQRQPYEGKNFPVPGEDLELADIIREALASHLTEPPGGAWQQLTARIHEHLSQENKRKNLLGEGFEDALAALIRRLPGTSGWRIQNRVLLGDIPGFNPQGESEKRKRVDLAIWRPDGAARILVTSKWSVRADREEQFGTDFDAYVRVNAGSPFAHVLITNEFDAARLKAACERVAANAVLFTAVVHVNPEGVLHAYGAERRGAAKDLVSLVDRGRLTSLEQWLTTTFR